MSSNRVMNMSDKVDPFIMNHTRTIPDPGERTANDPCYLMSSSDVLKLIKTFYNAEKEPFYLKYSGEREDIHILPTSGKEIIVDLTMRKIISESKKMGWLEVKLIGKQLLFTSNCINLR